MPLICYRDMKFPDWKDEILSKAIRIVDEYKGQGYDLTLRQVYYQFVARDWIPQRWADPKTGSCNNQGAYKKLGDLLGDARMSGRLDWNSMVDRTREMGGNPHWNSPADIIDACAGSFRIDLWAGQRYRPEVWVEKDALEGVVAKVCRRLDVPYFSCRGYTSLTSIWQNAQRLKRIAVNGSVPVILHLGDHDPSGIDMSRDIEERVREFMDGYGISLEFKRIALNMDQVEQYNPPENPAKSTDSRFAKYLEEHGESSWELDALEPSVIDKLITKHVRERCDKVQFSEREALQGAGRDRLADCSDNWSDVVAYLDGL